jgi:hypothetical protein
MHIEAKADQFELNGDKLTHVPTGAEFWAGEKDTAFCGSASGSQLLDNGHDYDPEQLKQIAREIFQQEKACCI